MLRVDLNELPEPMPAKWAKFNTVQVTMLLYDIQSLYIQGWVPTLIADITMQKKDNGRVYLEMNGSGMQLSVEVSPVYISKFSAYLKGDD